MGPRWGHVPLLGTSNGWVLTRNFFLRESRRKGRRSLALGLHCTFPGEPTWTALLPLPPSKIKVTAEVCCCGAKVGTCPPAWNKQWLGSDSKFFFEGKSEEGPSLPCSGAALHLPWRAHVDSPSPPPSLENKSHGGGLLLWGQGGDMSPCSKQAMVGF